jgi:hypothetical protein
MANVSAAVMVQQAPLSDFDATGVGFFHRPDGKKT